MDEAAGGHNHHNSWAAWAAPLLFHVLTEQRALISHACGESSSQRSKQLKLCSSFAPHHSPALRKLYFIQQLSTCWPPVSVSQLQTPEKCGIICAGWSAYSMICTRSSGPWPSAPCVASNSETLPISFFSFLLFSLFTFQELSEVFPVWLYPASVLIWLSFFKIYLFFIFFPRAASLEPLSSLTAKSADLQHPRGLDSVRLSLWVSSKSSSSESCSKLAACSAFKYITKQTDCQHRGAGRAVSKGPDLSGKWCKRGKNGLEKYPGKIHRYITGSDPRWGVQSARYWDFMNFIMK